MPDGFIIPASKGCGTVYNFLPQIFVKNPFYSNPISPTFAHSFMTTDFFKDKVVVVTGGTEGIGKALVEKLLMAGAKVAACGRNGDKLYRLQSEFPSYPLHAVLADVSIENDCRKFIESAINVFGGIDILINNAGVSMRALLKDTTADVIKRLMEVNFFGAVYCTRFALDSIIKKK